MLAAGAGISQVNINGSTALDLAEMLGKDVFATILRQEQPDEEVGRLSILALHPYPMYYG